MIEKKRKWVFDLDDTLWMNVWQYDFTDVNFMQHLYVSFPRMMPTLNFVRERYLEIEKNNFKYYGVKKGRTTKSMLQLYKEVCEYIEEKHGFNPSNTEDKRLIEFISNHPFDFTKLVWLDNAKLALNQLRHSSRDELFFITSYDKDIFPDKAKFLNLYDYFPKENGLVLEFRKTIEDFIQVSGWTPELDNQFNWYVVGNGESDILPALKISDNWRGFYIPHGSSSALFNHDDHEIVNFTPPSIDNPRVRTLGDIKEILNYI